MSSFSFPRTLAVFGFPQRNNCADRSCQHTTMAPLSGIWESREHWRWSVANTGGMILSSLLVAMSRVATLALETRFAIRNLRDSYSHYQYLRGLGFGPNRTSSWNSHLRMVSMQFTSYQTNSPRWPTSSLARELVLRNNW